jgi:hypothetical protein
MEIAIIFCFVGVCISLFVSETNKRNIEVSRLAFNELAAEHNKLTTEYNELVDSHNNLASDFDDEIDSSNKNFKTITDNILPMLNKIHLSLADSLELIEAHSEDDATH